MRNLDVSSLDLPHHWVMACTTLDVAMGIVNLMPRDKWAGGWKPYTTAEKTQQNSDDSSYNAVSRALGAEPWCGFGRI